MNELQKNHYKDKEPKETVAFLQSILKENNIEVEEEWVESSYIDTYSLRVNFKGTDKGANGKGITKDYARASAYAELFERYQNGILINPRFVPKDKSEFNYVLCADEKNLTAEQLVEDNSPFIKMYFDRRDMSDASKEEKTEAFLSVNKIDYMINGEENQYVCVPFYDVRSKKVYYLPNWVYSIYYGSNGMAAGNTYEEAIVQGLSEIYERHVNKLLFSLEGSLPTVPDEYIEKYPDLYKRYNILRSIEGYDVAIKDCSFEGKYPVVGLLILQKDTGKYGIKLGCHPDFGIALERTLTEAAQGADILEYVNRSTVDFFNTNVTDWINITNSFKIGLAQYPYQLFSKTSAYKFVEPKDVSGWSNKQMCEDMISTLLNEGYDVLIRDVSTLGFPSFHIIVPGLSELVDASDDKIRASNTRVFASTLLQNPNLINEKNCKYIIASVGYYSRSIMENGLESYYQDATDFELPYSEMGCSAIYLVAMCYVLMKNYEEAYKKIVIIEKSLEHATISSEKKAKLKATSLYLGGMATINNHEEVMEYISTMFNEDICEFINDIFIDEKDVIKKQFPNVSVGGKPLEAMELIYKYADILKEKQIVNPIPQERMGIIFDACNCLCS